MRLYIGRKLDGDYEFGTVKSLFIPELGFTEDAFIVQFFTDKGERMLKTAGLKLAPGEIRKVKSITIEVE